VAHAHPFCDGNGRTARTLFNVILGSSGVSKHFVPLKAILGRTAGAFVIHLRRAMLLGQWQPIHSAFLAALQLSVESQQPDG
jgi:hypothetical protein